MLSKTKAGWKIRLNAAYAEFESWLAATADEQWLERVEGDWTVKDLVGHLSAWSNLLLDQMEALAQGKPEMITAVDVDDWNAAQIARRRGWSTADIRQEWQHSWERAQRVVAQLPAEAFARRWPVAWAEEAVSINDLLELWLLHLEEHQDAWAAKVRYN